MEDSSIIDALKALPTPVDAAGFAAVRDYLRSKCGGGAAVCAHLEQAGFVADGRLTTSTKPFNVFARVGSGVMTQSGMEVENAALKALGTRFAIACNRPENDEHWASADPEWVAKASMSQRHRFMTTRDMTWTWFNVLTFGIEGDAASLREAIETLAAMQEAASAFASATPGWEPKRLGLFFHCYPHNSVNSLHMHLVDLGATGPAFAHHAHKNLPAEAVMAVLRQELTAAEHGARGSFLHVQLLAALAIDWAANTPPPDSLPADAHAAATQLFEDAEHEHGSLLVCATCGLLVSARDGLSVSELLHALSADDDVLAATLGDVPGAPHLARVPPSRVHLLLRTQLEPMLHESLAAAHGGGALLRWRHELLRRVAAERYATPSGRWHRALANLFAGVRPPPLPPIRLRDGATHRLPADRGLPAQPLQLACDHGTATWYNRRAMRELPAQLLGCAAVVELAETLISLPWLSAKMVSTPQLKPTPYLERAASHHLGICQPAT